MTFPFGYNPQNVLKRGIVVKVASEETYLLGIMTLPTPSGNSIKTYDIERALCDMVRTRHKADIQVVNEAMRIYAGSREKGIARLMDYAQRLRVKSKIQTYMEILLMITATLCNYEYALIRSPEVAVLRLSELCRINPSSIRWVLPAHHHHGDRHTQSL
jgi:hypothetical protein